MMKADSPTGQPRSRTHGSRALSTQRDPSPRIRFDFDAFFAAHDIEPISIPQYDSVNLFLKRGVAACAVMHYVRRSAAPALMRDGSKMK
ncbi:MAG: hypothetical protein KFB96_08850 [Thiocapsa sp.]|uniref:hypothetical protein n=1 Tax=Thiocapsa sp. TaxID=2024551 RepID=UPI001BCB57C2|nr:hypothetical protein [Thiocapsa sp.]QVL50514.1 MAG: hypothetical protein KFB96_08850 [Thiocapsa sp.]